jgi:hypothetical protein
MPVMLAKKLHIILHMTTLMECTRTQERQITNLNDNLNIGDNLPGKKQKQIGWENTTCQTS